MAKRPFDWRTKVIAMDFDGCLCRDEYPENRRTELGRHQRGQAAPAGWSLPDSLDLQGREGTEMVLRQALEYIESLLATLNDIFITDVVRLEKEKEGGPG